METGEKANIAPKWQAVDWEYDEPLDVDPVLRHRAKMHGTPPFLSNTEEALPSGPSTIAKLFKNVRTVGFCGMCIYI